MVASSRRPGNGWLPAFSVDTQEEADALLVLTTKRDLDGNYYAPELAGGQTLERLADFSERVEAAHRLLVARGRCACSPEPKAPRRGRRLKK